MHPEHYSAGLIYDDSRHYLDHLAPFCSLMNWPLMICENEVAELARKYYPFLEVIEKDIWELELPQNLVTCDTLPFLEQLFPQNRLARCRFFWLPHGNSDKGWQGPFFEGLLEKEVALVYGQRMIDFMHAKNISPDYIRVGNFRHFYYKKHQNFYDNLMAESGYQGMRNILYAPTWDDAEKSNSLWTALPILAESIDSNHRLIVKVHPNTAMKFPAELEVMKGRYEHKKNIVFLEDFPLIYPLLEISDMYIGDMSSIGYDFLTFNRPMFFLNPNQRDPESDRGLTLFSCGKELDLNTPFIGDEQLHLKLKREEIYTSTFDFINQWEDIFHEMRRFQYRI